MENQAAAIIGYGEGIGGDNERRVGGHFPSLLSSA